MTATERLRQLLDERGVEWEDMSLRPYACTSWRDPDGEPCTALEGADDIPDGKLSMQALLTPEQAVEATLGRGTCKMEKEYDGLARGWWKCNECGGVAPAPDKFSYCPYCGRKVVE